MTTSLLGAFPLSTDAHSGSFFRGVENGTLYDECLSTHVPFLSHPRDLPFLKFELQGMGHPTFETLRSEFNSRPCVLLDKSPTDDPLPSQRNHLFFCDIHCHLLQMFCEIFEEDLGIR